MALNRPGLSGYPEVAGDIAQGAEDTTTSYPVKIGGVGFEWGEVPPNVSTGDRMSHLYTLDNRPLIELGHPSIISTTVAYSGITTNSQLITSQGAGVRLFITDLLFSSDTIAAFDFGYGTTSVTILLNRIFSQANQTVSHTFRQPLFIPAEEPFIVTTNTTKTSIYVGGYYSK